MRFAIIACLAGALVVGAVWFLTNGRWNVRPTPQERAMEAYKTECRETLAFARAECAAAAEPCRNPPRGMDVAAWRAVCADLVANCETAAVNLYRQCLVVAETRASMPIFWEE